MIDKLTLWTRVFQVCSNNDLTITNRSKANSNSRKNECLLYYNEDNQPVFGTNAYYNYKLLRDGFNANLNIQNNNLYVRFNPSAFEDEDNSHLIDSNSEFHNILSMIKKGLKVIGINCNIDQMGVCRMDLAKDLILDHKYSTYIPMWNSLNASRMLSKGHDDSIYFENNSRTIVIYNKSEELEIDQEDETTRIELRLKKRKVVKRDLSIYTVQDLYDPIILNKLESKFNSMLKRVLLKNKPSSDNYSSLVQQLESAFNENGASGIKDLLTEIGLKQVIEETDGLNNFIDLIVDLGVPNHYYWRDVYKDLLTNGKIGDENSISSLYEEFYDKVLEIKQTPNSISNKHSDCMLNNHTPELEKVDNESNVI